MTCSLGAQMTGGWACRRRDVRCLSPLWPSEGGGLRFCQSGRSRFLGLVFPVMVLICPRAGTVPVYCDEFAGWHRPNFSDFLMVSAL